MKPFVIWENFTTKQGMADSGRMIWRVPEPFLAARRAWTQPNLADGSAVFTRNLPPSNPMSMILKTGLKSGLNSGQGGDRVLTALGTMWITGRMKRHSAARLKAAILRQSADSSSQPTTGALRQTMVAKIKSLTDPPAFRFFSPGRSA